MNECDLELLEKIDEHRKGGVMCPPDCWCWSAEGVITDEIHLRDYLAAHAPNFRVWDMFGYLKMFFHSQ